MGNSIYLLSDPRTDTPRYVGVTKDLNQRMRGHLSNRKATTHRSNWINILIALGLKPVLTVLEIVPDYQREDAERAWILGFRQSGADLVNATDGGEGMPNPVPEVRAKISAASKGNKKGIGHRVTAEHRAKISGANKGHKRGIGRRLTAEARAKISAASKGNTKFLGRKHTAETRAKMSEKKMGNKNMLGHSPSAETRAKISTALKRYHHPNGELKDAWKKQN